MTRFVKLDTLDPYVLFATVVNHSRNGLTVAFDKAFTAYGHCTSLLHEWQWGQAAFGAGRSAHYPRELTPEELGKLYVDAIAEDIAADLHAAVIVLFADDVLQRFAKGLLGSAPGLVPGFGPTYNGVALTTLVRAASNAVRHLSEWDDNKRLTLPYPDPSEIPTNSPLRKPLQNIAVIKKATGIGYHERVRDTISMRALIAIDGTLGNASDGPSYRRIEAAVIAGARAIADYAEESSSRNRARSLLENALKSV